MDLILQTYAYIKWYTIYRIHLFSLQLNYLID